MLRRNIFTFILFALSILLISAAIPEEKEEKEWVKVVPLEYLEDILESDDDTLYIINFWATWCKPCLKELPYFEKITKKYQDENVKVILVSLDYKRHLESRLIPYVKENDLQSQVVLLDAKDPNDWIPRIAKEWKGAIPATLVVQPEKEHLAFYEDEMTYKELKTIVKTNK